MLPLSLVPGLVLRGFGPRGAVLGGYVGGVVPHATGSVQPLVRLDKYIILHLDWDNVRASKCGEKETNDVKEGRKWTWNTRAR